MRQDRTTAQRFPGDTAVTRWLAVASILMFYSGLAIYGSFSLWSMMPLFWIEWLFAAFFAIVWINGSSRMPLCTPVPAWCALFVIVNIVSYVFLMGGDTEPVRKRILGAVFLTVSYVMFAQGPAVVLAARRTVALIVLVSVALNLYDLTHPFVFVAEDSEFANIGRAAGIYMNANTSGLAIVLGMILSVGILPRWFRGIFIASAIVGVIITFSRSAMLSLFVALGLLWLAREIDLRALLVAAVIAAAAAVIGYLLFLPLIESLHFDIETLAGRLFYFLDPASGLDYSQVERERVARKAWEIAASSPLLGRGAGTTELWDDIPSHNTYLTLGADFGVLGIVAYPLLIWLSCGGPARRWTGCAPAFCAVCIVGAFFDHGILVSHALLTPIALMAAISLLDAQAGDTRGATVPQTGHDHE